MASIGPNTIIGGNWKVIRFLGEGACAKVYEVIPTSKLNDNLGYDVVAKVIPLPGQKTGGTKASKKEQERICNTLNYEYTLYTGVLYQFPFCPRNPLKFYGDDATLGVRYLVMERLEQDLVGFAKQKVPSPAQVADIGIQILEGLRWLHNKTFLFVDVKPDNFMLKNNKLYFVDFGLTERVQDNPAPGQVAFNGTPTFSSVSADQGNPLAYRDDVEALGYVLLSLFSEGRLPWSAASSLQQLLEMKRNTDLNEYSRQYGAPELAQIISHCRELAGKNKPNYELCFTLLREMSSKTTAPVRKSAKGTHTQNISQVPITPTEETPVSPKKQRSKVATKNAVIGAELEAEAVKRTLEPSQMQVPPAKVKATRKSKKSAANDSSLKDEAFSQPTPESILSEREEKATIIPPCPPPIQPLEINRSPSVPITAINNVPEVIDMTDDHAEGPFVSNNDDEDRKSSLRSAYRARSSFGLVDGPFSSRNIQSMVVSRPAARGLSGCVKVRIIPQDGKLYTHDFRCPTDGKDCFYWIGIDRDCELVITSDVDVSKKHLKLKITKDDVAIMDDSSNGGTRLNGLIIPHKKWKTIQTGYSVVTIGSTKIEF